jgi:hypothetical protein
VGSSRLGGLRSRCDPRDLDLVLRGPKSFRSRANLRIFEGDRFLRRERPFGNLPGNGWIIPRFRCSAKVRLFFPERFLDRDLDFDRFLDLDFDLDRDRFRDPERRFGDLFRDLVARRGLDRFLECARVRERDCNRAIYI